MKKKIIIVFCILLILILLIPIPIHLKDGGTIVYQSILYRVEDVHSLVMDSEYGYEVGTVVKILGIEVYNDVYPLR